MRQQGKRYLFAAGLSFSLILCYQLRAQSAPDTVRASQAPAHGTAAVQENPEPGPGDEPVFQANTWLVAVDVVALDQAGNPVTGLKAENFKLLEEGKGQ